MIDFDVLEKLSTPKVWDGNTWVDLAAELRETRSKLAIAVEFLETIAAPKCAMHGLDCGHRDNIMYSVPASDALKKIRGGE